MRCSPGIRSSDSNSLGRGTDADLGSKAAAIPLVGSHVPAQG